MFKKLYKTFIEALRLESCLPQTASFYRVIAHVLLTTVLIYPMIQALKGTPLVVLWVALWALFVSLLVYVFMPLMLFLSRYGWDWETSDYYAVRKKWWNRLDHIQSPIVVKEYEMDYLPEKDAYSVGFYMSRSMVKDIQNMASDYDTDLAGVIDQGLGVLKLQNDARRMNTEALLIATHDQAFTQQGKGGEKEST